ncbi:UDP-N-acetylglucosamine transporter TMEM241 isoform X2 [Petromyzon marinus]|uniref:Transmembrane protein 241 isoform X2 n=1 Tax=Petromyzon marinus TaxID=7757 RepID=A0AAJ7T0B2_PETMA|nr:transmembrane protein 241 isoform X2 [Petromyzon marinus]
MQWRHLATALLLCSLYVASILTNKYVLSVLKFTYPTLFQGWQTLIGGLLLHAGWRLGYLELSTLSGTVVVSWFPGALLYVAVIYAGSRALSLLPVPTFLLLQNASEVVLCLCSAVLCREKIPLVRLTSLLLITLSSGGLLFCDVQFDPGGYVWALLHFVCAGIYKAFSYEHSKSQSLSVVALLPSSHPLGDLLGAAEFPFLYFYRFHTGCLASGILGFLFVVTGDRLKACISSADFSMWLLAGKMYACALSTVLFETTLTTWMGICLLLGLVSEVLLTLGDKWQEGGSDCLGVSSSLQQKASLATSGIGSQGTSKVV